MVSFGYIRYDNEDSVALFRYDALGRRVSKIVTGGSGDNGETVFVSSIVPLAHSPHAGQELAEYTINAAPTSPIRKYVYADYIDEPVMMVKVNGGEAKYYYHQNNIYSVAALTKQDGSVQNRYAYGPYGESTASLGTDVGNEYRFTGRRCEKGFLWPIYYYRARYYNVYWGRFMGRDPVGYLSKDFNLYRYCRNNPVLFVDPVGLDTRDPSYDINGHLTKDQAYQLQGAIWWFLIDASFVNALVPDAWKGGDHTLTINFLQHYIDSGSDWSLSYDSIKDDTAVQGFNSSAEKVACDQDSYDTGGNLGSFDLRHSLGGVSVHYTFSNNKIQQDKKTCKCYCRATINGHIHDQYDFHSAAIADFSPFSLNFEGWIRGWKGGSQIPDTWMQDLATYGYARNFYTDVDWSYSIDREVPCKK